MRADIKTVKRDGYKFVVEYDLGGDIGGDYTCWIYKDGKPLLNPNTGYQVRKYFGTKFNQCHFKRFVNKFLTNEEYRNNLIEPA